MLEVEVDRRDDLYEVQDQNPFSTCLSYATSSAHRTKRNVSSPLSAESLHYTASEGGFKTGCTLENMQEALFHTGQPLQKHCEPIDEENHDEWSPPTEADYYTSRSVIEDPSPQLVQDLIREDRLPILAIGITNEFHYPSPPWVFSEGNTVNYHAVLGAGIGEYNGEMVVLIRNSWGPEWCDSGYAWLDNSYLEKHLVGLLLIERDNLS